MFASLRHRQFRRYWIGLFVSNIGNWMQSVAQGWLVYRISGSALTLGAVAFAGSLPTLLLAPLAGVTADRHDRRRILIATQSTQLLAALTLAAATFFGFVSVPLVAAVALLNGIANAFTTPSHQSLFLDLVGRDDLMNAISLNAMQFNLSRIAGPAVAGFAIAKLSESACFLANAASFAGILIPLATMPPLPRRAHTDRSALAEMILGLRYARRDALIAPLLLLMASVAVFGAPAVTLAPMYARRLFSTGAEGLGGMLSSVGAGAVVTALVMARRGDAPRKGLAVRISCLGFAASLVGLAYAPSYTVALVALAVLGGAMMACSSLVNTLLQKRAPDRLRGRILSLYALAWLGLLPFGNLLAGGLAERLGARTGLLVGAAGIVAALAAISAWRPLPDEAA
jgi:MFS family permease